MKCINVNEIENEDNDKTMMESLADKEYELCLKNALREALDENEKVRNYFLIKYIIQMKEQIIKMEKEIEKLKIESKEKDDAIIELSQFYYVRFIYIIYLQYYQKQNPSDSCNEDNNEEDKLI